MSRKMLMIRLHFTAFLFHFNNKKIYLISEKCSVKSDVYKKYGEKDYRKGVNL